MATLLIIDDSAVHRAQIARAVEQSPVFDDVIVAEDGVKGLKCLLNHPVDVVLCDLEMPGLNGMDVLRTLKNEGIPFAAIMMTAFGSEAIAAQALRIGVKDYIIKPFTTEEILASVERALTESPRFRICAPASL